MIPDRPIAIWKTGKRSNLAKPSSLVYPENKAVNWLGVLESIMKKILRETVDKSRTQRGISKIIFDRTRKKSLPFLAQVL